MACLRNQKKPRMAETRRLKGKRVNFDWKQTQDYERLEQFNIFSFYVQCGTLEDFKKVNSITHCVIILGDGH